MPHSVSCCGSCGTFEVVCRHGTHHGRDHGMDDMRGSQLEPGRDASRASVDLHRGVRSRWCTSDAPVGLARQLPTGPLACTHCADACWKAGPALSARLRAAPAPWLSCPLAGLMMACTCCSSSLPLHTCKASSGASALLRSLEDTCEESGAGGACSYVLPTVQAAGGRRRGACALNVLRSSASSRLQERTQSAPPSLRPAAAWARRRGPRPWPSGCRSPWRSCSRAKPAQRPPRYQSDRDHGPVMIDRTACAAVLASRGSRDERRAMHREEPRDALMARLAVACAARVCSAPCGSTALQTDSPDTCERAERPLPAPCPRPEAAVRPSLPARRHRPAPHRRPQRRVRAAGLESTHKVSDRESCCHL